MTPSRMLERRAFRIVPLLAGLSFTPAYAADTVPGVEAAETLPIIDAHFHVQQWMDGATLLEEMDRHGVRMTAAVSAAAICRPSRCRAVASSDPCDTVHQRLPHLVAINSPKARPQEPARKSSSSTECAISRHPRGEEITTPRQRSVERRSRLDGNSRRSLPHKLHSRSRGVVRHRIQALHRQVDSTSPSARPSAAPPARDRPDQMAQRRAAPSRCRWRRSRDWRRSFYGRRRWASTCPHCAAAVSKAPAA
jgi:hypothetical protein